MMSGKWIKEEHNDVMLQTSVNRFLPISVMFVSQFIRFHLQIRNFGELKPERKRYLMHDLMYELIYADVRYKQAQPQTNNTCVCVSVGKKYYFYGKFCVCTK